MRLAHRLPSAPATATAPRWARASVRYSRCSLGARAPGGRGRAPTEAEPYNRPAARQHGSVTGQGLQGDTPSVASRDCSGDVGGVWGFGRVGHWQAPTWP